MQFPFTKRGIFVPDLDENRDRNRNRKAKPNARNFRGVCFFSEGELEPRPFRLSAAMEGDTIDTWQYQEPVRKEKENHRGRL